MAENVNKESNPLPTEGNETDFPPLPKRARPQALAVRTTPTIISSRVRQSSRLIQDSEKKKEMVEEDISHSSFIAINTVGPYSTNQTPSPYKRKMGSTKRSKASDIVQENVTQPNSDTFFAASSEFCLVSPMKKSKMMCYREPPLLKSLDSDTLGFLSGHPSFSDSILSDGENSQSTISPSTSTPAYENNNLGSLSDFIQQYSGTTLNSLPSDVDSPSRDAVCLLAGVHAISPLALPSSSTELSQASLAKSAQPAKSTVQCNPADATGSDNGENLSLPTSKKDIVATVATQSSAILSSEKSPQILSESKDDPSAAKFTLSVYSPERALNHSLSTSDREIYKAGQPIDIKKRACKKNPGHKSFYLPSELKVTDLPKDIQHEDSVTFFNCLSQLVVRITVERTSDKRPADDMYRTYIGTSSRRNGSGFIASVDERLTKIKCKREDCCGSDNPDHGLDRSSSLEDEAGLMSPPPIDRNLSNMSTASSSSSSSSSDGSGSHYLYGGVYINTNKHVIFDKSEADFAHVHFFYNTPDKKGVIHGHVASITGVSPNQDRVTLLVMSHDRSLFNLINLHLKNAKSSYTQMLRSTHMSQQVHGYGKEHSWAVTISHPHGLAKSITCGRVTHERQEPRRVVKYYDAATCPGSSGGLVTTPSLLQLQWPGAVHSCSDASTGYNVTFDSRFPDLDTKLISRIHKPLLVRKDSLPEDNIFSL